MIRIYEPDALDWNANIGIKSIPAIKAEVFNELDGEYYLELEVSVKYSGFIKRDYIVVVNTPWGEQGFRIGNPKPMMNKISAVCRHVYYDTENYAILDIEPVNKTCREALEYAAKKTDKQNIFQFESDIPMVYTSRFIRKNLREVIELIHSKYGGYLIRDNFKISIMKSVGNDMGETISYGKNLSDMVCTEDWDSVVTKLLPVGWNGLMLPEIYLETTTQYPVPYTRIVQFSPNEEVDVTDETAVLKDLRAQAEEYLFKNQYPKINYTIRAELKRAHNLGDIVKVSYPDMGIDIKTSVISIRYDAIRDKIISTEFGNAKKTLNTLFTNITNEVTQVREETRNNYMSLEKSLKESAELINRWLYNSHRYETEEATYFCNAANPTDATKFLIISLGGIGFGTKQKGEDITKAAYSSTWTLDNTLNMEQVNVTGLEVGKNVTLGPDAKITWKQVTGTEKVATTDDIPSEERITEITKDTISTKAIEATNLTIKGDSRVQIGASNVENNNYMYMVGRNNGTLTETHIDSKAVTCYGTDGYSFSINRSGMVFSYGDTQYFAMMRDGNSVNIGSSSKDMNILSPNIKVNNIKSYDGYSFISGGSIYKDGGDRISFADKNVHIEKTFSCAGDVEVSGNLSIYGKNIKGGNVSSCNVDFIDKNGEYQSMTLTDAIRYLISII